MSEQALLLCGVITCVTIILSLIGIASLRHAEARLRNMRLSVLEMRTTLKANRLNQIIVAENARLVAKGIDQGSLFVQGGHRLISEITFGILQLFPSTRTYAHQAREKHNSISDNLYGTFRQLSGKLGENIAEEIKKPRPVSARPTRRVRERIKKRVRRRKKG